MQKKGKNMGHLVITIGCEYGAKGNQIGKKVADDHYIFMAGFFKMSDEMSCYNTIKRKDR